MRADRPRFDPSPEQQERLTRRFVQACATGDLPALLATLADAITLWSDGGARVAAARRPIHGADNVARFLLGLQRKFEGRLRMRPARVNGQPALVGTLDGERASVLVLDIAGERIGAIRLVVNPDKLGGLLP